MPLTHNQGLIFWQTQITKKPSPHVHEIYILNQRENNLRNDSNAQLWVLLFLQIFFFISSVSSVFSEKGLLNFGGFAENP